MSESYGIVAKVKKRQMSELLVQDKRLDGRGLLDYRDIKIEVGLIQKAAGSALVSLGNTKVMTGVKLEMGTPFPDTPAEGVLVCNAELVPLASPSFEPGPPSEDAIELARVVDRGIRESKAIDTSKLCIVPGKKVFMVYVDMYVLDHDGNLFDASALASIAALLNAQMKEFKVGENGEVEFGESYAKLPIVNRPVEVTAVKINNKLMVDPSLDEEAAADTQITIAVDQDDHVCAMQKSKPGTFTSDEVMSAVKNAQLKAKELREKALAGITHEQ